MLTSTSCTHFGFAADSGNRQGKHYFSADVLQAVERSGETNQSEPFTAVWEG